LYAALGQAAKGFNSLVADFLGVVQESAVEIDCDELNDRTWLI